MIGTRIWWICAGLHGFFDGIGRGFFFDFHGFFCWIMSLTSKVMHTFNLWLIILSKRLEWERGFGGFAQVCAGFLMGLEGDFFFDFHGFFCWIVRLTS